MFFKDNLINLRKEMGMSQEDLAERLDVSRQTIYKWETGQNFPEMDRLVEISKVFNCSIDDLIKKEIKITSRVQLDDYFKKYNKIAFNIAFGVGLVIAGVATMLLLFILLNNNSTIPIISLFIAIGISVMVFIINGIALDELKKTLNKEEVINIEKSSSFVRKFSIAIAIGVALIIISVVVNIVFYEYYPEDKYLSPSIMLFIISIGVFIIVLFGIKNSAYSPNSKIAIKKVENPIASKISSAIMLTATAAYLILGFIYTLWHPGWVVFPIAGILCAIVSVIFPPKSE